MSSDATADFMSTETISKTIEPFASKWIARSMFSSHSSKELNCLCVVRKTSAVFFSEKLIFLYISSFSFPIPVFFNADIKSCPFGVRSNLDSFVFSKRSILFIALIVGTFEKLS